MASLRRTLSQQKIDISDNATFNIMNSIRGVLKEFKTTVDYGYKNSVQAAPVVRFDHDDVPELPAMS